MIKKSRPAVSGRTAKHIKQALCRLRRDSRAASAVEFALVAPVFLVLTMGIIELGRAAYFKSALQFAVEEAGRHAIVTLDVTSSDLITKATEALADGAPSIAVADANFIVSDPEIVGSRTYRSITASYSYSVLVPLVPIPDITLSAKSRVPLREDDGT